MANFGWAYVNCTDDDGSGQAAGPTGSVQFLTGHNSTLGVTSLVYHTASDTSLHPYTPSTLVLSGNLLVTGSVSASIFHFEDITRIDATGSTFFGNTTDDTHLRTGSLVVKAAGAAPSVFVLSASAEDYVVNVAGFAGGYSAKSANFSLVERYHIYGVQRTTATVITVPAANAVATGIIWTIKDEVPARTGAGNNITLTSSSPVQNLFDNETTYVLTGTMPAISLYSNGTNWFVF